MSEFIWPIRVYYEDTDSGGVVYYANYLKFMERARTECLRSVGFEQDVLREKDGIIFAVRSVSIDYLKPARFNNLLNVVSKITKCGHASMTFKQDIKIEGEQDVLCSAEIKIACLDSNNLRPCPIPAFIMKEIPCDS
ncbi:MAG: tol-pal system-associated acyl-CoA thioesterase [Gammaproteobacteria bacterium]|nr:tol-pal system-associated acyl-CoA thioesterase [Gammaproteobacteria bacterium]MDH5594686.1 tol-pal system-associated acyl-CoA thioesterase [Gammaproteobacteria bacterium]MDH5613522.1 tol-pal system-associated acyl-CoA thioesterase [Gammaproteobacteria bacterium]